MNTTVQLPTKPATPEGLTSAARLADLAGELVRHIDQEDFFTALAEFFRHVIDIDNFIVYRFRERFPAELIGTNLNFETLKQRMAPYINGLYLLDPFYIAATSGRCRGVVRMEDIAPGAFSESDYFGMFYKDVNVIDEVRFLVEFHGDELIHVFLEREAPHARFTDSELQRLRDVENLVTGMVEQHWKWRAMSASLRSDSRAPLNFGLRNVISSLKQKALTAREIDIAELTFKGHSAKSIAYELGISEGTVISHKRHIYEKLEISSQSQFFHLLLEALYGSSIEPRLTPPT
jgi:DNA-binding CsgD family transcriptional regulator